MGRRRDSRYNDTFRNLKKLKDAWNFKDFSYRKSIVVLLYVPLFLTVILAFVNTLTAFLDGTRSLSVLIIISGFLLFFIAIGLLFLVGRIQLVSILLIAFLSLGCYLSFYLYGFVHPYGLILCFLSVQLMFLLLDLKVAVRTFITFSLLLFALMLGEYLHFINFDASWVPTPSSFDYILIPLFLLLFTIVTWIHGNGSDKQIERIQDYAQQIKDQNANLQQQIVQRTKEILSKDTKLSDSHKTLRKAYNLLEDSEKDRFMKMNMLAHYGSLLSSVVHQFANPLMVIMSSLQEVKFKNKKTVMQNLDELADMVRTVRSNVKIDLTKKSFNVDAMINYTIKILKWKFKKHNIEVRYSPASKNKGLSILGDSNSFHQIVLNLIDNAIEACVAAKREKCLVKVSLEVKNQTGFIKVEDNGPGIPASIAKEIFQMFYSTKETGSGIGLFIARKYARELFNGDLILEKSSPEGSIFAFTFAVKDGFNTKTTRKRKPL